MGFDILGTDGTPATTVRAVCERAGLNPRYFYESFAEIDALLAAIYDRQLADLGAKIVAAVDSAPPDTHSQVHAGIATTVEFLADDPRRGRVALVEAVRSQVLIRRHRRTVRSAANLVGLWANQHFRPPPEASRFTELASYHTVGGLLQSLIAWLDGDLAYTPAELIEENVSLFVTTGEAIAELARRKG